LYNRQGRFEEAAALFQTTINAKGKSDGPSELEHALAWIGLGNAREGQSDDESALYAFNRALEIYDGMEAHLKINSVFARLEMAQIDFRNGHLERAERLARHSVQEFDRSLGSMHPNVSDALEVLGDVLRARGMYAEAEAAYQKCLTIRMHSLGSANPRTASVLRRQAALALEETKTDSALELIGRAVDIVKQLVQLNYDKRQGDATSDSDLLSEVFSAHLEIMWKAAGSGQLDRDIASRRGFEVSELARRFASARAITQMSARFVSSDPRVAAFVRRWQDLAAQAAALNQALVAEWTQGGTQPNSEKEAYLRTAIRETEAAIVAAFKEIQESDPKAAHFINADAVDASSVDQRLLAENELIIRVFSSTKATYVWVIGADKFHWERVSLSAEELDQKVAALRCGLDREEWEGIRRPSRCRRLLEVNRKPRIEEPLPFSLGIAHELYQALLGPVEDMIKGKHLLIVPSGPLTSLPFQVLVTAKPVIALPTSFAEYQGVAWLGERQPLTVLPSVDSLEALRKFAKTSPAEKAYLGYGNPSLVGDGSCRRGFATPQTCVVSANMRDHSQRSGSIDSIYRKGAGQEAVLAEVRALCPLPDTAFELQCVARSLGVPDSEIRLGATATEADIKRLNETGELANYRVIHFATHGLLAGDTEAMALRQGEPALVMTPPDAPKDGDDDGLLTASEVAQLKLNADWVILSACNTAAGDKLGAQALSGLARAFFYAGARALLVSHWPVYSDAAVQLLDRTFAELRNDSSIGRSEAFRRAMTALIEDPDNAHPSVWAPFSLVGEGAK
jgi:CHAT domain-containing protein